ncbi:MAG: cobyric acid synthase [Methanomicrobiales archaeon]|nr:cobyric acid synthase [Methanomicrobiales archaeon]
MSVMVLGTASHVGKSTVVAALCRALVNRGYTVAPFKSQNMSLNSFVTRDGGEIGIAQAVQAFAARVEPMVDMNPVLLKPKGDRVSQVVLLGRPYKDVPITEYYQETDYLLREAVCAADRLIARFGHIVVEGAGGAAEVNLYTRDIANTLLASALKIPIVLIADIERGGVFAQTYGTIALLPPGVRAQVCGIIINKFRGDPAVFQGGVEEIERLTGVPVLGVLPYMETALPSEDSLSIHDKVPRSCDVRVAVIRLPRISNFTDFEILERYSSLHYCAPGASLSNFDCIIIPGTKNTIEDLKVLQKTGTDLEIQMARCRGIPVIGICGGYQMLGETIVDVGIESDAGEYQGLGLLPVTTSFRAYEKTTCQVNRRAHDVPPILSAMGEVRGYEIHMGETVRMGAREAFTGDGAVSEDGLVIGTYLHGLFQNPAAASALLSLLAARKGLPFIPVPAEDDGVDPYDLLAAKFEAHVRMGPLLSHFTK